MIKGSEYFDVAQDQVFNRFAVIGQHDQSIEKLRIRAAAGDPLQKRLSSETAIVEGLTGNAVDNPKRPDHALYSLEILPCTGSLAIGSFSRQYDLMFALRSMAFHSRRA